MSSFKISRVLISDAVDPSAIEILKERNISVDLKTNLSKEQLIDTIRDFDALIVRSSTTVTSDVIEAAKQLKVIGRAGVGVDNIDCESATKNGVIVINAPAGNTISAVELTCTMILALSRQLAQACASLKSGVWDRKSFMGNELKDKTLAIIGLGRIGREVAIRMQSFGMRTIGFDPLVPGDVSRTFGVESYSLDQIWPLADYITVHTPLIPQTKNMLNETTLGQCRTGVKIINCARGGIIDEEALLRALQSGQVGGAGLDVFEEEPPKCRQLLAHPKVICTPHLGASTKEAQKNVAKEIALQFIDMIDGKPVPGVVNAPLLSEMLKPANKSWSQLGESLGKLAIGLSPQGTNFKVLISGETPAKIGNLISASVLVGLLKGSKPKSDEINLISAPNLATQLGLSTELSLIDGVPEEAITVYYGSISIVGVNEGKSPYLNSINKHIFSPPIALKGNLAIFSTSTMIDSVLSSLIREGVNVISITSSNGLFAVHSTESIGTKPKSINVDNWVYSSF
jgi:D-3-phosphoglycerate dehydrogenase